MNLISDRVLALVASAGGHDLKRDLARAEDAEARVRSVERLQAAGQALNRILDPARVAETVAAKALDLSGAAAAMLFRLDVDARLVHPVASAGSVGPDLARLLVLPVGQGAAG